MTESEEMYLVTIARIKETCGESPVPLSTLAADLDVLPVSANQMIRKLEDSGWVTYQPYKGVELSERGMLLALQILRRRRLWEVFLVERLRYTANEASTLACRLEHALPPEAADRLADFLGNPQYSPLGEHIPLGEAGVAFPRYLPLSALQTTQKGAVVRIEADTPSRAFLTSQGVLPGSFVEILGVASDGDILLSTATGSALHLSASLAKTIWVQ